MTAAAEDGSIVAGEAGPYSVLLVGSMSPHAGKTALAAGIALKLAYEGRRMLALRLAGDDSDGGAARADAAFFRTLPFARGRGGEPVSVVEAARFAIEQQQGGGLLVTEAPAGADLPALAEELKAGVVLAVRSADAAALKELNTLESALGGRLIGVVAMAVPRALAAQAKTALQVGPAPVLGVVPEDATLYAPSVLEVADALDAEVVLGEPDESQIVERLMVGSITTDPGAPYYARPRSRRAVITRSDKTDLQLAAMHTDIDCLILTGGVDPSPYTIDRAADGEITVLLTKVDTRGAVRLLEDIFLSSRFSGDEKLEHMQQLLEKHLDWEPLRRALSAE